MDFIFSESFPVSAYFYLYFPIYAVKILIFFDISLIFSLLFSFNTM